MEWFKALLVGLEALVNLFVQRIDLDGNQYSSKQLILFSSF